MSEEKPGEKELVNVFNDAGNLFNDFGIERISSGIYSFGYQDDWHSPYVRVGFWTIPVPKP